MGNYINFNGNIVRSYEPVITADSRGLRYGDGIFETIRVTDGSIILSTFHFDRLFSGIQLLQFEQPAFFTREILTQQVNDLCKMNGHQRSARVRLTIFRGKGGLYDSENNIPNYIIDTQPLAERTDILNKDGLIIDIFPNARKSVDVFSNLKSNNYLSYAMGAMYAQKNQLNDCLILNSYGRICDSTIANIFCVKDNIVFTPHLSEGCISGVMRRYLLSKLVEAGFSVQEKEIEVDWLQTTDEIFLTNAIYGIRWVQSLGNRSFRNAITSSIYDRLIKNIDQAFNF